MTSVCLCVRPHDNFRKYFFIATKLAHVNMCHCRMFPVENRIRNRSKEIRYITVNGRYLFKGNFSNVKYL